MTMDDAPGAQGIAELVEVDEAAFDGFARNAGASLRSTAPKDGFGAVVRQGKRQRTRRLTA